MLRSETDWFWVLLFSILSVWGLVFIYYCPFWVLKLIMASLLLIPGRVIYEELTGK